MTIKTILRKGRPVLVKPMTVGELNKDNCSAIFLEHNFPSDMIVNVKCFEDGDLDYRFRMKDNKDHYEYRIIVPDKV